MLSVSARALKRMYSAANAFARVAAPLGSGSVAVIFRTSAFSSASTCIWSRSSLAEAPEPSCRRTASATSWDSAISTLVAASRSGSLPLRLTCSAESDSVGEPKTTATDASYSVGG